MQLHTINVQRGNTKTSPLLISEEKQHITQGAKKHKTTVEGEHRQRHTKSQAHLIRALTCLFKAYATASFTKPSISAPLKFLVTSESFSKATSRARNEFCSICVHTRNSCVKVCSAQDLCLIICL